MCFALLTPMIIFDQHHLGLFCCPRVVQQLTIKKKFSVIEVLKYFQSWTKSGGYMEGIWRLYKDDWRLYRNMEVIQKTWRLYMKYGGCIKIMEVVWNKGRYRAARAAKKRRKKKYHIMTAKKVLCKRGCHVALWEGKQRKKKEQDITTPFPARLGAILNPESKEKIPRNTIYH